MSRKVRAFHGTTLEVATKIIDGTLGFQLSNNGFDWLGEGIYFFEESSTLAIDWARGKAAQLNARGQQERPAVISADIDLTRVIDLCSGDWSTSLALLNNAVLGSAQVQHPPVFQTTAGTLHVVGDIPVPIQYWCNNYVDAATIDALALSLARAGSGVTAKRAAFVDGRQIYANSYFFDRAHVQIAVIDQRTISKLALHWSE